MLNPNLETPDAFYTMREVVRIIRCSKNVLCLSFWEMLYFPASTYRVKKLELILIINQKGSEFYDTKGEKMENPNNIMSINWDKTKTNVKKQEAKLEPLKKNCKTSNLDLKH